MHAGLADFFWKILFYAVQAFLSTGGSWRRKDKIESQMLERRRSTIIGQRTLIWASLMSLGWKQSVFDGRGDG